MIRPLALGALALLVACGSALAEGESQFKKGRYPEAKQTFDSIEPESRQWDDSKRAQYDLYRGLTHGALGDRAAAGVWLREAKAIEDARPGTLSSDDLARLKRGLDELDATTAP